MPPSKTGIDEEEPEEERCSDQRTKQRASFCILLCIPLPGAPGRPAGSPRTSPQRVGINKSRNARGGEAKRPVEEMVFWGLLPACKVGRAEQLLRHGRQKQEKQEN